MTIKHPEITVNLVEKDGNAVNLVGRVTYAMRNAGVDHDEIDAFSKEALSGDYDHVLQTIIKTVNVE